MVLNGLGVIIVGPEGVVNDDAMAAINLPRRQGNAMTVIGALDPK